MKKLLSIIITVTMLIGIISVPTLAAGTVTNWTIKTDKPSYAPGDYMKVYITNSTEIYKSVQHGTIQFTYNPKLLTLVTVQEIDNANISKEGALFSLLSIDKDETPVSVKMGEGVLGVASGEVIGTISGTFASNSSYTIAAGKTIMTAYFKVNADVLGKQTANFSFVYKDTDGASNTDNNTYVYNGTGANETEVNINYIDGFAIIDGGDAVDTNVTGVAFVPDVYPTEETPFEVVLNDVNRTVVSITTPYIVGYSSIVAKKGAAMKEAGVVIADGSAATVDINNCREKFAAQRFTNNNRFGILVYGSYFKPGKSYQLRFYITYSDDSTVYSNVITKNL